MVVMDVANPFFTDIVSGVEDYVHDLGYSVQLGNSAQQTERAARTCSSSSSTGYAACCRPDQRSRPKGC